MFVTYLLYVAGLTVREYVVMAYSSLLCKDFEQRLVGARHYCIHKNVQLKNYTIMKQNEKKLHSSAKHAMRINQNRDQLVAYFKKVLSLRNSGDPFPVDLDEVWPLAYSRKNNAVRVLLKKFKQGEHFITQLSDNQRLLQNEQNNGNTTQHADYQFFRQNAENNANVTQHADFQFFPQNGEKSLGRPSITYKLSSFCFEYLIAREVPEVFMVYVDVFYIMADTMTPINGVYPILYRGCILYNYNEILRSVGFSTKSGCVSKRKRMYPGNFLKEGSNNYISAEFARFLIDQKKFLDRSKELRSQQYTLLFSEQEPDHAND